MKKGTMIAITLLMLVGGGLANNRPGRERPSPSASSCATSCRAQLAADLQNCRSTLDSRCVQNAYQRYQNCLAICRSGG